MTNPRLKSARRRRKTCPAGYLDFSQEFLPETIESIEVDAEHCTVLHQASDSFIRPILTPQQTMTRREKLQQMLQDSPEDTFLLYGMAMDYASSQEWEPALATFDQVLSVDPGYVAAYFQKGQILARMDRIDDARSVLSEGIEVGRKVGEDHAVGEMTDFLQSL